jgi:hypothetical protein
MGIFDDCSLLTLHFPLWHQSMDQTSPLDRRK